VEGGSKVRIETDWSLADVEDQHSFWLRNGPPSNIVLTQIAGVLGIRFEAKPQDETTDDEEPVRGDGPSILELSKMVEAPRDIGGTLEASKAVFSLINSGASR